jgi:hypothetical protein
MNNSNTSSSNTVAIIGENIGPLTLIGVLTAIIIMLFTVCGNLLVIISVIRERKLRQQISNYLILSLAVTDLIVGVYVIPICVYSDLEGWNFGGPKYVKITCIATHSIAYACYFASALHLLIIAIDRFCSVSYIHYARTRNLNKICALIAIAWIVALTLASLPAMGWRNSKFEERIAKRICFLISPPSYGVFVGIFTFYGPFIVISILYWRIFLIARKSFRCKPGNRAAAETAETKTKTEEISIKMKEMSSFKGSKSGLRTQTASGVMRNFLFVPNLNISDLSTSESKEDKELEEFLPKPEIASVPIEISSEREVTDSINSIEKEGKCFRNLSKTSSVLGVNGKKSPKLSSYSPQSKRERRTAKALAIVILAYVVCVAPIYLTSLVIAAVNPQTPPRLIYTFATYLGLINSMINPFIYARFIPQFRVAMKKIFSDLKAWIYRKFRVV